jgi:hypothetical protein
VEIGRMRLGSNELSLCHVLKKEFVNVIGYFVTFRKRFCPLDPFDEGNSYLSSKAVTCLEWSAVLAVICQKGVVQRRTG